MKGEFRWKNWVMQGKGQVTWKKLGTHKVKLMDKVWQQGELRQKITILVSRLWWVYKIKHKRLGLIRKRECRGKIWAMRGNKQMDGYVMKLENLG